MRHVDKSKYRQTCLQLLRDTIGTAVVVKFNDPRLFIVHELSNQDCDQAKDLSQLMLSFILILKSI